MNTMFEVKLNKNLVQRTATKLVFDLNDIHSSIHLNREEGPHLNAKSLLAVLAGKFGKNEIVTVNVENFEDESRVKDIFEEVGIIYTY